MTQDNNMTDMPELIFAKRYGEASGGTYWEKQSDRPSTSYIRADHHEALRQSHAELLYALTTARPCFFSPEGKLYQECNKALIECNKAIAAAEKMQGGGE